MQALISRRQDNAKAQANIAWLRANTHAHLHVDLIAGLPGEDLASFAAGLRPAARAAPARDPGRHPQAAARRTDRAPHRGLRDALQPSPARQRAGDRPAAVCDDATHRALRAPLGSGRQLRPLPFDDADVARTRAGARRRRGSGAGRPLARFLAFSDWLAARTGDHARLSAENLFEAVREWLGANAGCDRETIDALLSADYVASGLHGRPGFMQRGMRGASGSGAALKRQRRFAALPASRARPWPALTRQAFSHGGITFHVNAESRHDARSTLRCPAPDCRRTKTAEPPSR